MINNNYFKKLKISVITITYNCQDTIQLTIDSVLEQTYKDVEYIIIDGSSTDNTFSLISKYGNRIDHLISEKDNGIYDAINKGIRLATGELVAILHSGDIFYNKDTLSNAALVINKNLSKDIFFSNAYYINNFLEKKIVRKYSSKYFKKYMFLFGFMPAHTTTIIKKSCFEKYGYYNINFEIAGDFDLLFNYIYINNIPYKYIDMYFTIMLYGGKSTSGLRSKIKLNNEILNSIKIHKVYTNKIFIYSKYFIKIWSYIFKL